MKSYHIIIIFLQYGKNFFISIRSRSCTGFGGLFGPDGRDVERSTGDVHEVVMKDTEGVKARKV